MFYATGLPGWMRFGVPQAPAPTPEVERQMLEGQVEAPQAQLEARKNRLAELQAKK